MVPKGGIVAKRGKNKEREVMENIDSTIVAVLRELGRPVHRTKLVKLIYLIDELYYRHFGDTMTGLNYMWDDFGPNAIGNAIVKKADRLALKGIVHIDPRPNVYGETSYLYSLEKGKEKLAEKLSEAEQYVIRDVVAQYRNYGVRDIVKISKQTESFKNAEQYSLIKMKKSAEYEKLMEDVKSDPDFIKGIEEVAQTME
jgi:uncharacterized phage-associated protein